VTSGIEPTGAPEGARAQASSAAGGLGLSLPGQDRGGLELLQPNQQMQEHRTISAHVADTLRQAIYSGSLADGTTLNQVVIAKALGVSRVPVREAMQQLQAEGLITVRPHYPAVVTALTVDRVSELFEIQSLLEEYIAQRGVPRMNVKALSDLRAMVNQMKATNELEEWLRINAAFHIELNRWSGAELAIDLSQQLRLRGQRYLNLWSDGKGIDRIEDANREHGLILDLIAAGDIDGACAAIKQHVLTTRDKAIGYHRARTQAD
jgi:DNA-binding GntR family transcriptional regulator